MDWLLHLIKIFRCGATSRTVHQIWAKEFNFNEKNKIDVLDGFGKQNQVKRSVTDKDKSDRI
jgi:hypothetical protein